MVCVIVVEGVVVTVLATIDVLTVVRVIVWVETVVSVTVKVPLKANAVMPPSIKTTIKAARIPILLLIRGFIFYRHSR